MGLEFTSSFQDANAHTHSCVLWQMLFTKPTSWAEGTHCLQLPQPPSAENSQPGWSRAESMTVPHQAGMDIREERQKQSILNPSSWTGLVVGPNIREVAFGKAAGQLVKEITFLTTKAKSETAYLLQLPSTCSDVLPGQIHPYHNLFHCFYQIWLTQIFY